uniref:Fraser extracellular matrix complex subunit 1 n=1 Tax=Oncorhynchus kisutch TaxID=8019 RepID=A0A8C7CEK8_ONCKI
MAVDNTHTRNNTSWRPDSCQECQCFSDITVCQLATCLNPHCDYQRGERLRIPPNQCCPECLPSSQGSCQHDEAVYGHDSQWSPSQCQVCVCSGGSVSCRQRPCPPLSCPPDQTAFTPAGDCCPKCHPVSWEDHEYRDGEEWRPSPCSKCVCMNGRPQCFTAECQPVACTQHESLVIQPGQCCPQCLPTSCLSAGREHKHGEQWQKSSCTRCVCDRGQSRCHTHTCPPRTCEEGQTKVKRAGQCCDDCVAAKGSCLYELTVRYHGDMWNGTDCEFCTCERGQVLCQRAQCARVECPTGSELVHLPGKCCPECQSMKTSCVYPDPDLSSGKPQRPLANQERWNEGPCRECECREGRVTCYLMSCPTCPLGTLAVPHQGTCCPECKQVQCQRDCLSCSGTPDHCESCKDSTSLLLDGRCVSTCPRGYYADGKVCAACQSSCATCENDFECSSCGGSLLLNNRHCVATCDPGSYQDPTQCLRCHASCSVCVGPSQQECVLCSDPSHLLREGLCVPDCGSGFYIQQGTCYGDVRLILHHLLPRQPQMHELPLGSVMHHGKCISNCPDQHYLDSHGHCRACHSSCWSCSGSAVSQCSLCTQGLSFHQGQCLEACGQGLYHQDGTCLNCHPSCRTCVGPLSSDCLRCLKPEQALQPRTSPPHTPLPHGVCVAQCPAPFYLDTQHTCRECHTSCLQCTGGSSQNCTSCSPPYVLQEGQCVSRCPPGHTVQDNTCQGCHPSCQECSGTSQADCVSCSPLANFNNGYCRTSCPDGLFLHPQGFCQECSSNCQRCVADLQTGMGSVCLWCKIARTLLLGDHCVTHCPQGHYPWHGACKRCHVSCEGCSGEWPLSCTSCPSPSVLLTSGLCGPACPLGYYADRDRRCRACDGQCLSCELSGVCTACRDPGKVLLFGECRYDSCAYQYYLNTTTRTCRECDWSCNECKGPLRTDCLQCMEGHVLQDGLCVQGCSSGSYQDGERCLSCDEQCEGCQGPGQCGRCQPPYATLRGRCVLECGRTYFLDSSLQLCTSCSADCVECERMGRCTVCRQDTYLRNGYCTPDCGHGFYADKKTWTCHGKSSLLFPYNNDRTKAVRGTTHRDSDLIKSSTRYDHRDSSTRDCDLIKSLLEYSHEKGDEGGSVSVKFNLVDPDGNKLIDQSFYISILEDHLPPSVVVNKGLVLDENSVKKLTTLQLSATAQDSEPGELLYRITKQTALGHLEHARTPGSRITSFSQADLASRSIQYVHTSEEEKHTDEFSFIVSDGANECSVRCLQVAQTFYITIRPVDDSLPLLVVPGMRVQEGVRKTITEFELKATDADTEEESITFTVVQAPRHGTMEWTNNGQHYRQTNSFSMDDVYQNRISYNHDGSNSLKDRFTFTVADGTNVFFMVEEAGKEVRGRRGCATNLISKKELLTMDPDTDDGQLVYEVTAEPKHGFLQSKLKPGAPITTFTQADVNQGLIRYVLFEESVTETVDNFKFLVKDGKPNVVSDNLFHIQWSFVSFQHRSYNVSEKAGTVSVTVKRTGNLNQYAIVLCRTEQGTATSTSSVGSLPGQHDYVEYAGQVQFDEREDTKVCTVEIQDDKVFEGVESFQMELSMPVYALLGQVTCASVNINDTEDEPTLQFDKKTYHVNEGTGFIHAPIERKGDTSSTVSALCHTVPKSAKGSSPHDLESGSDYKSRGMTGDSRVIFGPGVSVSTCDVKLIDDSEYELSEEFELHLSDASDNARMGDVSVATVVIDGPNDASTVSLGNATFTFSEDAGTIEIPVMRQGSDLSSVTSVWCATRPSDPPSATPGVDYIPSSRRVEFKAGKTMETCSLTIMDDIQNPAMEGSESFVVFLSSPQGAVLLEPFQASVVITDTLDLPSMQFEKTAYKVTEKEGVLDIPVIRTGDLTVKSSVRCFTRTMSAMVMDDFEERRNADDSRISFLQGEKVKNCTVHINDDSVFEPEEEFQVHLGTPLGDQWSGAMVGVSDVVTVTITNDEDAPTIKFEQTSYQVREPPGPDGVEVLHIKVVRTGDQDRTSKVRCSTRDGSAQSGVDYNPKSRVLKFTPGMDHILFNVEILSNEDREWHESFSLVLGPDDPVEAVLGEITTATVTILDQEAVGSLILPATPIVVSLSDYDNVAEVSREGSKKQPSPGYPLVCVTPCDPHYPKYSVMRERCGEAGINQTSVHFSWEVAAPTDTNGARSPFETVTDTTPYTGVNHMVLDSIYFSRRFHVRCVAQARDKSGHLGTPLRSNIATVSTECSICHTPVTTGTARGFQAQSFIATLKYLDVKHKRHPNRIHISVQIPHQDGMLPLLSSMPLHNLHFLLSESIYRQQHVCSNLVTLKDLQGVSETGFLDDVQYDSISLGPGYDRPYQFNPGVREAKSIQLYKHLNMRSCIWTFDAYYDMTELIDVCGGSVTADFQARDSAQSFLTVQVPLYVSYIYVTAPRGWASLEHHTEMEFSFFYDTVLWRTGEGLSHNILSFKTHWGHFVQEHHTLPGHKSHLMVPDHLGGIEFDMQLIWSAQSFDSPYQLWKATSSYSRKDYSGEYTVFLIPCTVQPTQSWTDPGDKPLSCTAHAPEKFQLPIAFQQTNRPVPVVYSLNTEFQLCNNENVFMMDPAISDISMAELDYKGAFSMGQTLYGRVLWNPEQNLNSAYKLQLEKVYLCTGRDGYVPFFDPTGTLYNEGPQYGCIQTNKHLKHRFLILDRKQPEVCDRFFHDVPFEANFASDITELQTMTAMPGVDGFTMKVDALYKVEAGHQWYLQVIYVIGPESISGPRIQQSIAYSRARRDLVDQSGHLTLDESLIYDNEGDQTKNGTNMKILRLEVPVASTFNPQMGGSTGGGVAALTLLVLVLLGSFLLFRKCRRSAGKKPSKMAEEYPLNTKVEVYLEKTLEKNFSSKHCTVRNINLNINRNHDNVNSKVNGGAKVNGAAKVKQVNLEVKLHNNLGNDGTEV